jgi:hypothetical protein
MLMALILYREKLMRKYPTLENCMRPGVWRALFTSDLRLHHPLRIEESKTGA